MAPQFKIAVIGGGGMVGAATAYALILREMDVEVLIVDVIEQAALGQALDVSDASFDLKGSCRVGNFREAGQCDMAIITAGYPQKPGESRELLLGRNKSIMRSICENMAPIRKDLKILVVANPVDVLTHLVQQFSGLPKSQVFGSGTWLDSGRLRNELAKITGEDSRKIEAYVLGEHGDRQFVYWSGAKVNGSPLLEHPKMKDVDLPGVMTEVMRKAYNIIDAKRSTYFGIGKCAAAIADACLNDKKCEFPLVHYYEPAQCYCSWPCQLSKDGVGASNSSIKLNPDETQRMSVATKAIKDMIAEADSCA